MISDGDGVVWLEALAVHYEEMAREIRAVARGIRHEDSARKSSNAADVDAIPISEAVRRVLGENRNMPMRPLEIITRIKASGWPIRTRSKDLSNLIMSTLGNMRKAKHIVNGADGWRLTS